MSSRDFLTCMVDIIIIDAIHKIVFGRDSLAHAVETAGRRRIFRKSHAERDGRKVFKAEIENHRNKRRESQYDSLFELRTNKKFTEFVASDRDAGGFPERFIRPMVGSSFFHLSGLTGRENKRFDHSRKSRSTGKRGSKARTALLISLRSFFISSKLVSMR